MSPLSGRWATSTAIGRRGAVGCFADPAHGQNRQAEIPNSREQSMECRLIDDWADQHGCAVVLPINREAIKPIRPGVIDVSPKMDLIGVGPTSEGACRRVVGVHCLFTLIWMLPVRDGEGGIRCASPLFTSIERRGCWSGDTEVLFGSVVSECGAGSERDSEFVGHGIPRQIGETAV